MLPDGIRNASTKNVRMKRKIARAPAIDFTFSQIVVESERLGLAFPRAAATLELFDGAGGVDERFLVDATVMREGARNGTTDCGI
jgi:hypothetical protein